MRSAPIRALQGSVKPQSAQAPLCGFTPPTVWTGVVASQRPIACPNRRIQPERYMQFGQKWGFKKLVKNILPYELVIYHKSQKKKVVYEVSKKYDIILSIGPACRVAYYLKKCSLRLCAAPLDWMMSYSLKTVLHLIETDFNDFFKDYYEDNKQVQRNGGRWVVDRGNNIISLHYDEAFDNNIKFREMMTHRWYNTRKHLREAKDILFLSNRQDSIKKIRDFASKLSNIYRGNITFINIRDTYISGIQSEIYRINDHVEIIEYKYNDKHPLGWEKKDNEEFYIGNYIIWEKILGKIGLKQPCEQIDNEGG
jgi:hypothetical protein